MTSSAKTTEELIRRTHAIALQAKDRGNHPFGALLAVADSIVLEAGNTVHEDNDCTRHAEFNLVAKAVKDLDPNSIAEAVLYTSTEPCPMCCGALYWAGIRSVVYSCPTESLAELAGPGLDIPCRTLFSFAGEKLSITGPILKDEGIAVHGDFWKNLANH
eukprot:ANDGO_05489.mRNA.1 putative cytosine deaminase